MHLEAPTISATKMVSVTAIVPVRNEAAHIKATLDQILDQELANILLEVLVVDGGSSDATCDIVKTIAEHNPQVRLLHNPRRLSSAARNIAINESRGDYVVVIDGHCELSSRRYFQSLVDAFETTGADCLGRPQPLNVSGASHLQRAIAAARASWLGHQPASYIYATQAQFAPARSIAVAYRRDVFARVGLFDESFDAHEDGDFNYRCDQAGLRCYFTPAISATYFPRSTLLGLFRQLSRYGRGRVRFARKHGQRLDASTLLAGLLPVGLLAGGAAAIAVPLIRPLYIAVAAVYLLAVFVASAQIALRERAMRTFALAPAAYLMMHFGAGWGVISELLAPGQNRGSGGAAQAPAEATAGSTR